MIGLMGPRGVGKTTLVLQHIKEQLPRKDTLYVQAEDFYFASHRLTELADSFAKMGGKYLFIDEIHKYKDFHPFNEFPNRKRRLQTQETVSFRGESYELGFLTKALK